MKKIIFCSYNLDIGGIERAIINYLKGIEKEKYDVYLMLEKEEGMYLSEIPRNVKIINYNICESKNVIIRKTINALKLLYFTLKYYNKFDFSACFATSLKSSSILAKRFSKNNAIWMHGEYWNNSKEANDFIKYINLEKYKKVIFVSEKGKEKYLKERPSTKQKLYTINNPIDYKKMLMQSNKKIDVKKEKIILLNVGRHEEFQKSLSILIAASSRLLKEGYDFDLWLVGDGPDKYLYEKLVKKYKITKNVKFFGKKSNVYPYYKLADCIVLSSRFEGNPVVFLEAKVMNKPIITTDVSDARKELKGYGIVTEYDSDKYYEGLKEFLDNGYKIKRKFNCKKYNEKIFSKFYKMMDE